MNLFRPYQMGEPQRDARGRLVGIDRYQDVLGRNWKRFFLTGLVTLLGCLPLALGVGVRHPQQQPAGAAARRPCGRGHRGALFGLPVRYHPAGAAGCPRQLGAELQAKPGPEREGRPAARRLHGAVCGGRGLCGDDALFLECRAPHPGTVLIYLFSCLLFLVLSTLYWTQLVLFDQRAGVRLRNGLLFVLRYFWVTLGTGLLQLAWWVLMVLFAPWTLLLMPFVGSWFVLFAALFLLYDRLDQAFAIEESISRAFPEQARHEER